MRNIKKFGMMAKVTKEEQARILSEAPALIENLEGKYAATNHSIEVKPSYFDFYSNVVKFSVRDAGLKGEGVACLGELVTGLGLEFNSEEYKKHLRSVSEHEEKA